MRDRLLAALLLVPFTLGLSAAAPAEDGNVMLTFADPEIVESSGLVVRDGLALTTNDSGDTGRVFAVEVGSGRTVGVTRWSEDPTDVEALAPAPDGDVWVGDVGDNNAVRSSIRVARIQVGRGERTGEVASYELGYPDGPANAESLLSHPVTGRLYVATKTVFGGTFHEAPARLSAEGRNVLRPMGDVLKMATDGAFFADGRHVVVRNYTQAAVYTFPELVEVGSFYLPSQQQGEAIAVLPDGDLAVSTEGQYTDVLRVPLPQEIRRAMGAGASDGVSEGASDGASGGASQGASTSAAPSPEPSATTRSRVGRELPEQTSAERPAWPWFLTAWIALGGIVLLMFVLRRRG
ncbi:hypothetical protein [Nocardioides sp.]|uniref:hypothetical protein n=1 Tax=Nocardioides sp. TaxID=35761 RepID=UPI0035625E47